MVEKVITLNENDYAKAVLKFEKKNGHKKGFPASFRGKHDLSQRTVDLLQHVVVNGPISTKEIAERYGYKTKDVQNSLYQARASGLVHTTLAGGLARWVSGVKPRGAQL